MTTKDNRKRHQVMKSIWLCCVALVVVVMLYGVIRYPHAPIRFRGGGYFDKAGREFTQAQFELV